MEQTLLALAERYENKLRYQAYQNLVHESQTINNQNSVKKTILHLAKSAPLKNLIQCIDYSVFIKIAENLDDLEELGEDNIVPPTDAEIKQDGIIKWLLIISTPSYRRQLQKRIDHFEALALKQENKVIDLSIRKSDAITEQRNQQDRIYLWLKETHEELSVTNAQYIERINFRKSQLKNTQDTVYPFDFTTHDTKSKEFAEFYKYYKRWIRTCDDYLLTQKKPKLWTAKDSKVYSKNWDVFKPTEKFDPNATECPKCHKQTLVEDSEEDGGGKFCETCGFTFFKTKPEEPLALVEPLD